MAREGRFHHAGMLLILWAACLLAPPVRAQQYMEVPIESPIYDELEHFRSLGLWKGTLEARPITRAEAEHAARAVQENAGRIQLGRGDQIRLRRLLEYLDLLSGPSWTNDGSGRSGTAPPPQRPQGARPEDQEEPAPRSHPQESGAAPDASKPAAVPAPPVHWELDSGVQFFGQTTGLDPVVDLDRRPRRDSAIYLVINAAVGRHLTAETRNYEDYSRLTPEPGTSHWVDNLPLGLKSSVTDPSARNDRALLGVHSSWFDLEYGRGDRRWGPGRRGSLFLSENPFPLDGLSFRFRTPHVSGVSLFAQTRRAPNSAVPGDSGSIEGGSGPYASLPGDAYMAAHRFEVDPPGPASFGFFEAVIWGGRGIDLGYVNPVGFLVAMTQDHADLANADDKKILGADCLVRLRPVSIYGEFLLNRLITLNAATSGPNAQISSLAELVGLRWSDPMGLAGADLDAEYAHLDPEVYFHKDGDVRRAYLTQGELIGHWAGPNSDDFYAAVAAPPFETAGRLRLEFEQVRWGLINGLRGVDAGFVGLEKKDKRWIVGPQQVERTVSLRWSRPGWRARFPGLLDADLSLARVDRTGAWSGNGWQAEIRLRWHIQFRLHEGGGV